MRTVLMVVLMFMSSVIHAERIPPQKVVDPQLEERVDELTSQLRCLVCDDKTIADSNSLLAKDLRNKVRQMLLDGKSSQEILDYMKDEHGTFIKYRSAFEFRYLLIIMGPLILIVLGVYALLKYFRERKFANIKNHSISDVDNERIERLMSEDSDR